MIFKGCLGFKYIINTVVFILFFSYSAVLQADGLCDLFVAKDANGQVVSLPETADEDYEKIYLATIKALNGKFDGVCKDIVYGIIAKSAYYANSVFLKSYGKSLITDNIGDFVLILGSKGEGALGLFSKNLSVTDVVEHVVDIAADVTIELVAKEVKDERYRKPAEWWMKIAYTDVKGAILYAFSGGNWSKQIEAASGVVVGNLEILAAIGNENWKMAVQLKEEKYLLRRSKKIGSMLNLYSVYSKKYYQSIGEEDKKNFLNNFIKDCKEISSVLDLTWTAEKCYKYQSEMVDHEINKGDRLIDLLNNGSKESFEKFVGYSYSSDSASVLINRYGNIKNYFRFPDVVENNFAQKYLVYAAVLGINIYGDKDGFFRPNENISISESLALIFRTFYSSNNPEFIKNKDISKYYDEFKKRDAGFFIDTAVNANNLGVCNKDGFSNQEWCLKRKDMSIMMVRVLGRLPASSSDSGWDPYSQSLKNINIVNGNSLTRRFDGDKKITRAEFLKMLTRSKLFSKCYTVNLFNNFNDVGCDAKY